MTLDKSLKRRSGLTRMRSVLSRAERIEKLTAADRWKEGVSPLGLPKVRVYKLTMKKKKKRKEDEEGTAAAGTAAPAAGAAAKGAAAKGAPAKKDAGKK